MLRIGICDDSQHDRDLIRETVGKTLFDYVRTLSWLSQVSNPLPGKKVSLIVPASRHVPGSVPRPAGRSARFPGGPRGP